MPASKKTRTAKSSVKRSSKKPSTTTNNTEKLENKTNNKQEVSTGSTLNKKLLMTLLSLVVVLLLGYRLFPWFVPATVNKKPITRYELYKKLNQTYGKQMLDEIVNKTILDQAIEESGVKVSDDKVNEEISKLEEQFKNLGGLDKALEQRGITRDDLKDQIKTQLAVEEMLKDKITPSDDEVKAEYEKNKDTLYKNKKFEDVKDSIAKNLRQSKLGKEFLDWFKGVKDKAKVQYLDKTMSAPSAK